MEGFLVTLIKKLVETGAAWGIISAVFILMWLLEYRSREKIVDQLLELSTETTKAMTAIDKTMEAVAHELSDVEHDLENIQRRQE